jgi:hypothetical protein
MAVPKIIALNANPTWADVKNDFVLQYEEHVIGRIRLGETGWEWHITVPMEMPGWARGSALNLEDCKKAFGEAWGRFLSETDPERLERAWEFSRAAEQRRPRADDPDQGEA